MTKPITVMMISKFENLNLSGTKMVGIKMLLEFWMKTKEIEEKQGSVLKANQRSMLEDLNTVYDSTNSNQSLAEVSEKVDINAGVKQKLEILKQKERLNLRVLLPVKLPMKKMMGVLKSPSILLLVFSKTCRR